MQYRSFATYVLPIEINLADQVKDHERIRLECEEIAAACERMRTRAAQQREYLNSLPDV